MPCESCNHPLGKHDSYGCTYGGCQCHAKVEYPIFPTDARGLYDLEQPFESWVSSDTSKKGKIRRITALNLCGVVFVALGILLIYSMITYAPWFFELSTGGRGGGRYTMGWLLVPFLIAAFFFLIAQKFRHKLPSNGL